jgi:hypothetical protein
MSATGRVGGIRHRGEAGMIRHRLCITLLAGGALAALALPGRAGDAPGAPATRTVCVTEWVTENVLTTRTSFKTECVQERYTAFRTECVPQTQTRVVTVNRVVPEVREEVRTVCVAVPAVETRTVFKPVFTCVPVTTVCRKCVDVGHWECREVPCRESCLARLKRRCCHECCEPCPPPTKVVKVWVPCKVEVEVPVTRVVRTCQMVPTTVQVTVCRLVPQQQTFKVCSYRCVPEQRTETFTVLVPRQVAYEAVRTVARCVPVQEQVTVCRIVPRTVQKQVPVEASCCP